MPTMRRRAILKAGLCPANGICPESIISFAHYNGVENAVTPDAHDHLKIT